MIVAGTLTNKMAPALRKVPKFDHFYNYLSLIDCSRRCSGPWLSGRGAWKICRAQPDITEQESIFHGDVYLYSVYLGAAAVLFTCNI